MFDFNRDSASLNFLHKYSATRLARLEQPKFAPIEERSTGKPTEERTWEICNINSGQTLQGSFSAVSKPKFASKYSLESS